MRVEEEQEEYREAERQPAEGGDRHNPIASRTPKAPGSKRKGPDKGGQTEGGSKGENRKKQGDRHDRTLCTRPILRGRG